jgi:predicted esterase
VFVELVVVIAKVAPCSGAAVHTLLESDVLEGIDPSHIFFGGLSQGGALATYSAYTYPKNFAGIILLSCWLPVDQPTFLSVS